MVSLRGRSSARARRRPGRVASRLGNELYYVYVCLRSGALGLESPRKLLAIARAFIDFGMLGGSVVIAAIRHPQRCAVVDERGSLTYRELDQRTNAIANAWIARGLRPGDGVAVLARNHRGFLEAVLAGAKCGARVVLMNTGFSGHQVAEVARREGVDMFVADEEYGSPLAEAQLRLGRLRAWTDTDHDAPDTLEALTRAASTSAPPKPARAPRLVILTSGTTGMPKGAGRDVPFSLSPIGGPLSKVPFRSGDVTQISAPMFHALGFTQALLQIGLGATIVLQRRFEERELLHSVQRNRVSVLILVPVMLQRLLAIPAQERRAHELSSLRIIYLSGSQLGADLALRAGAAFGPVLYNLYGSTEIAYATIATPEDLAAAPSCVGRVVRGARVRIFDGGGRRLPDGQTGRIFVGNMIEFEGYTGGEDRERVDGLVCSGDLGHFDGAGRLFIDGRDDEMIISGGENVFPAEVEELLCGHPGVLEAAAIAVADDQFGQVLKVYIVARNGATLDQDEIRAYVRAKLERYKVPREVAFIDELPRNPTGKVLKRLLG
ncbi:MAG: AMP-binding protein [Solirubrobacteraceae bacterium]